MILNCPECKARFLVGDHLIPRTGRVVRCGSCGHQWPVTPVAPAAEDIFAALHSDIEETIVSDYPDEITPLKPGANVPAIARRTWPVKPFKIAVPLLACVWLVLAFVTYFPSWSTLPGLSSLYHVFGVTDTRGLSFANVHMQRETADSKTRFIFSGTIINHAKITRHIPLVHIALNDKQGHPVWGRDYPVNVDLKPDEVYPFKIMNVETSFADKVATIILDLGNHFELMVR